LHGQILAHNFEYLFVCCLETLCFVSPPIRHSLQLNGDHKIIVTENYWLSNELQWLVSEAHIVDFIENWAWNRLLFS